MRMHIAARLVVVLGLASATATASAVENVRGYAQPGTYYPPAQQGPSPGYPAAYSPAPANTMAPQQRVAHLPAVAPTPPRLPMQSPSVVMNTGYTNAPVPAGAPARVAENHAPMGPGPAANGGYSSYAAPGTAPASQPCGPIMSNAPYGDTWSGSSPYMQAMQSPWDNGACAPTPMAPVAIGPACPRWFGGVYGLIMNMQENDPYYFLNGSADPARTYLSTRDVEMETSGGVEARFGRTFCNCRWGLEFVYWGLYPSDQQYGVNVNQFGIPGFNTTMDYRDVYLNFNGAVPRDTIDNWYNGANPIQAAFLRRTWEFHNFEVNVLSGPMVPMTTLFGGGGCRAPSCGPAACGVPYGGGFYGSAENEGGAPYAGDCGPVASCGPDSNCGWNAGPACGGSGFQRCFVGWVAGFRYFRFNEGHFFYAENDDGIYDYNSPNNEFGHEANVTNHLAGFQTGLNLDYFITRCFNIETGSRFGVYGNNVDVYQRAYNLLGPAYTNPNAPNDFVFNDSSSDVAFIGEMRSGIGYKIGCHWRLTGGYRLLAASGVARSIDQIPHGRISGDQNRVGIIDRDGTLILHGAYAGCEFAW
jgi:hypothetical protein